MSGSWSPSDGVPSCPCGAHSQEIPPLLPGPRRYRFGQQVIVGAVSVHVLHALLIRGQVFDLVVGRQVRRGEVPEGALRVRLQEEILGRRCRSVEEGGLLAVLLVLVSVAGPRADDPLDEVAHGEQQQQDQDARQLPRKPADVVEEDVDGELAAALRGARAAVPRDGQQAALMALHALDSPAAVCV